MENRIERDPTDRPGAALIGLVAILAITAAWWALALWPTGGVEPEWLARTRSACFGSSHGGLPDTGGWILLAGEPLGMLAVLVAGWRRSLQEDLRWIRSRRVWRFVAATVAAGSVLVTIALGARVARAWAAGGPTTIEAGVPRRVDRAAPPISLVDQRGAVMSFADFRGRPVLLTFAYGHCSTVCPSIVHDLHVARRTAARADIPLVIITLDPWRDTPDRLPTLAEHWMLAPGDAALSGSVAEVEQALDRLEIGRRRNETTGDIDHAIAVMLLNSRGQIAWRIDGGVVDFADLLRKLP